MTTKNKLSHRVISSVFAHLFSQGVTILTQLGSLPVFLHYWDMQRYGVWLMLSALPIYLSMADVGIMAVTANKVTMLAAKGDNEHANRVFQSALALVLVVFSLVAIAAVILIWSLDIQMLAHPGSRIALTCLTIAALTTAFGGLLDAAYRSAGQYAKVTYYLTTTRIVEWLGSILGVALFGGIEHAAIGYLIGRLASTIVIQRLAQREVQAIKWSFCGANWKDMREMLRPGISLFIFPIATALNVQGMILLIGNTMGPTIAALFNTYRVLTRVMVQLPTLFGKSLWPELSRLYALKEHAKIHSIYIKATAVTIGMSIICAIFLYFFGEQILAIWSHGKIHFQANIFGVLLISAALTGFWQIGMVVLASTNRHQKLSIAFLLASLSSFGLASALVPKYGLMGIAGSLILVEVVMIWATFIFILKAQRPLVLNTL
ncbi:lipopolysaccharide biosynthesis protein [Collimonas antrihumi]|uniref:lipopolysaccharide biosynthesis protein n=1 Tax=Collimonas antrihumi TaxID=1940615 RepID=UPI001B8C9ED0|nr:oligosaccharide flippase family protein [Collimonas antrihumi]